MKRKVLPRHAKTWWALAMGWVLATTAHAAPLSNCLDAVLGVEPDFSGVVLLKQRGVEHVVAMGKNNVADAELRPDARFNLGSANKMFTAVAVLQLVAQGKLSLDAPIGRWVDGLPAPVAAVTLHQLLTHSGGLGNFVTPDNLTALQKARTLEQQLALVNDELPMFEPGSKFLYSNTGFLLLGRAVERASGKSFATYLQDNVFKPASMTQSSLDPASPTPAVTGLTRLPVFEPGIGGVGAPPRIGPGPGPGPGAVAPNGPPPAPMAPPKGPLRPAAESALPGSPAGSGYSTAADMARFIEALESGKLLEKEWVNRLVKAHIDISPPGAPTTLKYGLGFGISEWQGHAGYGHNGGAPGVNVEVMRYPQDDALIVVLTNRDPPVASRMLGTLRTSALKGSLCR